MATSTQVPTWLCNSDRLSPTWLRNTGLLDESVVFDAVILLLRAKPVYGIQLDLGECMWVYHAHCGNFTPCIKTSKYNSGFIRRWQRKNNFGTLQGLFSDLPRWFSESLRKYCSVVISMEPSSERYGFFFKFSCPLGELTRLSLRYNYRPIHMAEVEKTITAVNNSLIAAEKSTICYLDELVTHLRLTAPSGLKCLALLRLFCITEETNTEFENKKQKAF